MCFHLIIVNLSHVSSAVMMGMKLCTLFILIRLALMMSMKLSILLFSFYPYSIMDISSISVITHSEKQNDNKRKHDGCA